MARISSNAVRFDLSIFEVLNYLPSSASEGTQEVVHSLLAALGNRHVVVVQVDPLAPFPIVLRMPGEQRDEAVPSRGAVQRCSCRFRCHLRGHLERKGSSATNLNGLAGANEVPNPENEEEAQAVEPFPAQHSHRSVPSNGRYPPYVGCEGIRAITATHDMDVQVSHANEMPVAWHATHKGFIGPGQISNTGVSQNRGPKKWLSSFWQPF